MLRPVADCAHVIDVIVRHAFARRDPQRYSSLTEKHSLEDWEMMLQKLVRASDMTH